jgi:uncharacterized protein YkwD
VSRRGAAAHLLAGPPGPRRLRILVLAAAAACATGPSSSTLPGAATVKPPPPPPALSTQRYGVEPPVETSPAEARAVDLAAALLQRSGEPPPVRSSVLALAARELAARAASGERAPLGRSRVRAALWNAASFDPWPQAWLVSGPKDRVADALPPVIAPGSGARFLGAGAVERDGMAWLVLLASSRPVSLRPFPRNVAVGDTAVLDGELGAGLEEPRIVVTGPDGKERERTVPGTGRFRAALAFDAPGRWLVEVFGRGPHDSTLVALLDVSAGAGTAAARLAPAAVEPDPEDQAAAEALVLAHLNATRRRHGLPPLLPSPALRAVARAHSTEMMRAGQLSQALPGSGSLVARLQRARIPFKQALQNIAREESALSAHRAIEANTAQLENLLATGPTLAGVGISRGTLPGGGPVVYLTEVLVEPAPEPGRTPSSGAGLH